MSEEDRSYIPYYYGMNWQAPPGGNREVFSSQGLGLLAGRAMRQGVVGGADAGLWLERLAGVPLEPSRMMIDWGGETKPDTPSDWTSYRTLPEVVSEFAGEQLERALGPVVRSGEVLRGRNPYGQVDEINLPSTVKQAAVMDAMGAVGIAATPQMFGSRLGASTVSGLGGREALLSERQALINRVKGIKSDYDKMVLESSKVTGLVSEGMVGRVADKFKSAYDVAREKAGGGSFVDIAVLRDNLGLSQEKMAGLLRKASREGHAMLELGEPSVVDDYLKGGMVDGKLLVRLDPEFFDNISSYIKPELRKSLKQMEVDEIEKELLR